MVINFHTTSASESGLSADFPSQVHLDEEFNVSFDYSSGEKLDVKIFVHNSSDEKVLRNEIISEILDSDWKDSWLYIIGAFPEQKTFSLKVNEFSGNPRLCIQLRKSGKTAILDKFCNNIKIINNNSYISEDLTEQNKDSEKVFQRETENNSTEEITASVIMPSSQSNFSTINNNLSIVKNQYSIIKTKTDYLEKATLYLFLIFTMLIILLIIRRKI